MSTLQSKNLTNEEGLQTFEEEFRRKNRSYADVSIGIEVAYQVPYIKAQQLDKKGELVPLLKALTGKIVHVLSHAVSEP